MSSKIQTLHPEGKSGVRIDLDKYTLVKDCIVALLTEKGEMTFGELASQVELMLKPDFEGSIPWYLTTVKLDLEARNLIERVPRQSPQRLRLCQAPDNLG